MVVEGDRVHFDFADELLVSFVPSVSPPVFNTCNVLGAPQGRRSASPLRQRVPVQSKHEDGPLARTSPGFVYAQPVAGLRELHHAFMTTADLTIFSFATPSSMERRSAV